MISAFDPIRQMCLALYAGKHEPSQMSRSLPAHALKAMWDCPGLPLIALDSNNRICRVNAAVEVLLDKPANLLTNRTLSDLFPDLSLSMSITGLIPGDHLYCSLGGERIRIILIPGPSQNSNEQLIALLQASLKGDITSELVGLDAGICRETETILELAYDLVTVTDGQGKAIRASSQLEELFGIPVEDFIGHGVRELVEGGVLSQSSTLAVLNSHSSRTLVQQTKSNRSLVVTGVPIRNSSGQIVRVVNFTRDITDGESLRKRIWEARTLLENYQSEINFKKKYASPRFGKSTWQRIAEKAESVDSTVLITGESGVGKEVLARSIHAKSPRCRGPFVKINCAAIPETLFESELFGYERGAFTGANEKREGLIWQARGGTLVLDEVSELPGSMQAKLLHLLQDREYTPVGGVKAVKVDIRIIAITNRDLPSLVEEGAFRKDVFYRLNVLSIYIPPLRQRQDEISGLIDEFSKRFNRLFNREVSFGKEAIDVMLDYTWPGNVRELENFVERMIVISEKDVVTSDDVLHQLLESNLQESKPIKVKRVIPLRSAVEILERELLTKASEHGRSTRDIGRLLGINQSTVVRKMKRYGMSG